MPLGEPLILFIYLFLVVLSLCCCMGFSRVVASGDSSLVVVCGLLSVVASLVAVHGSRACGLQQLQQMGSVVVVPKL